MPVFVTCPSMPELEEYIEEIKPVFENRRLTNMGPVYKKFQYQLKDYLGVPEISLFTNGHMALEMSLQALGIAAPGKEVITTPFSFVSTTHAIVRNNLRPVFCDICPEDYTMDAGKIEELITEKTAAIVPVHVYGNPCDTEEIQKIADRYGLKSFMTRHMRLEFPIRESVSVILAMLRCSAFMPQKYLIRLKAVQLPLKRKNTARNCMN